MFLNSKELINYGNKINITSKQVLAAIATEIRKTFVQYITQDDTLQHVTIDNTATFTQSNEGLGKVRYLGGRAVFKTNKKCTDDSERLLLGDMRTHYDQLKEGPYNETLNETERRQNAGRGLTHITDKAFSFFMNLEEERCRLNTVSKISKLNRHILSKCMQELTTNTKLTQCFSNIFEANKYSPELQEQVKINIMSTYIAVTNNDFRKKNDKAAG